MESIKNGSSLAISAILVEALITYSNQFFVSGNACWQMFFSIILGIIVAVAYCHLPEQLGMTSKIPYIGCVITGILISRGANYLFDFSLIVLG